MLRVWTSVDFDGHYPVGTAAVVVAETEEQARTLLRGRLEEIGLRGGGNFTLQEINTEIAEVTVLRDGDY